MMEIFYIKPQIFGFLATVLFCQVSSLVMPEKYEIIRPLHLHPNRHRRDLSTREKGGHLKDTTFGFTAGGRYYMVDISINSGLLSDRFLIGYQLPDGNLTETRNYQHCYYHGKLSGKENTAVVLSTCNGLRGTIKDENGKVYGIEPTKAANDEHIFYNLEDVPTRNLKCGVEGHDHDFNMRDVYSDSHLRFRRSVVTEKKYVSLAFINDKRQWERMGKNVTTATNRAIEIANHVDSMLKTINTRGALVYVETWNVMDLAHIHLPAGKTLVEIRKYNKDVLVHNLLKKGIKRDNVQLISGIDFEGLVIGMAGIGTICGLQSTGVNMDYTSNAGITAGTVAHELGHNLGFAHDGSGCSCGGSPCVMASSGGGVPIGFTTCSKDTFEKRLSEGLGSCLFDVPTKLVGPPVCGNDFLEKGEECDCGSVQECAQSGGSACCNATTCKLHNSAQCAVGPCCQNCSFVQQGVVCRKPGSECDLEEACTGISQECPANFYKLDGMSCKNNTAYCFEGGCRTSEDQCAVLWGKQSYKAHTVCFRENMKGSEFSNCGQNELGQYIKCAEKDFMCGTVQCANPPSNGWPIVSSSKSRTRKFSVRENGVAVSIECNQAVITLGPDLDNPTLTPSGTKCDDGAICINHKCANLTSLAFIKTCPKDQCFNGGICNNLGHCHCPVGFACPDCKEPGPGGSVDSGHRCFIPESKKKGLTTLSKSLLIIFLGVVPAIAIGLFVLYKFKHALPCTPGVSSSSAGAQAAPAPSKPAPSKVPDVTYHPQQPSKQAPNWLPQQQQQPTQSYSNDTYRSSQVHMNPSPKATPSRPPPSVPSHPKSPGKAPLPPLRPVVSPPGAPKPAKLPPMPPSRP